jgi:hypothetical protein
MYTHAVALLQRQFLKLHTSALQSLAVAGYQTACTRRLLTCCSGRIPNCSGRITNCMHAAAAVALLQWQDTKLHARMAALLQWQVLNLLHRANLQQQKQQSKM